MTTGKMGRLNNNRGFPAVIFLRRLSQGVFLTLFFVLFLKTDYNGTDHLDAAVNILFRLDPFIAACVMLGVKSFVLLLLPSLAVLLLSVIIGRGFCGWFCPMGTLLDLTGKMIPQKDRNNRTFYPNLALIILVFALFSSACGFSVAGYFDPFSLLVRGMAQALYPLLNSLTFGFFSFTYRTLPAVNHVTEPVYSLLQTLILPSEQKYFHLAALSFFLLGGIFLLEGLQRRFFCRNICPLGAMLGTIGRWALVAGKGGSSDCGSCGICSSKCRMGAIDAERKITMAGCNLCLECVQKCPRQIIHFGVSAPWSTPQADMSLSRRRFVGAAIAGVLLPSVTGVEVLAKTPDPALIRPPGALEEKEFLSRCVRCAECIQVCIGNALQPAFLQAGFDGMFSPVLAARSGYCEFNCTLCGQVCPTGAIRKLSPVEKHRLKIGHAWFDKNTCLPYAKGVPCMVCEEHCPTPDKAIRFNEVELINDAGQKVTVQQPYVVSGLCIGCGICENKCPLPGKAAVYITSAGEDRNPNSFLPSSGANSYPG